MIVLRLDEIKVLVPGAGLGRLVFEIAVAGFCAQGNEFSLHMLIVSNFILNKLVKVTISILVILVLI